MSTVTLIGWVETDSVVEFWPEAEDLTDAVLTSYLTASWEQCVEFLPPVTLIPYPLVIPERWVQAQVMQARALHRSNVAGSGDQMGGDGLGVTVYPMDWTIKNLLRPRKVGRVSCARTDLAEHLAEVLPDTWRVVDHDSDPAIAKPTVMVWVERAVIGVTSRFRMYTINVVLMTPKQTAADDDLEAGLEEVLEAIDLWDYPINWRTAEYSIYAEKYPAYKVTCEAHTRRDYPSDTPAHEPDPEQE